MARLFDFASLQYLTRAAALVTGVPFTLAAWVRINDLAADSGVIVIGDTGATNWHGMRISITTGIVHAVSRLGATNVRAESTAGVTTNTWCHVCGVWTSTTSRAAFMNGANKGTNASSCTPSGLDTTDIGAVFTNNVHSAQARGDIAEVSAWNVALTDADVANLAKAVSPLMVKPANLLGYWPLIGRYSPEIDLIERFDMTLVAAPVASPHPRMFYPPRRG